MLKTEAVEVLYCPHISITYRLLYIFLLEPLEVAFMKLKPKTEKNNAKFSIPMTFGRKSFFGFSKRNSHGIRRSEEIRANRPLPMLQ